MKTKWKVLLAFAGAAILAGGIWGGTVYARRGIVTVQTGRVLRQDLTSQVTASGEIKPRNYINIGANAQGQITELLVKEGERVRKGQLLARLESVQPQATVSQAAAELSSVEARTKSPPDSGGLVRLAPVFLDGELQPAGETGAGSPADLLEGIVHIARPRGRRFGSVGRSRG